MHKGHAEDGLPLSHLAQIWLCKVLVALRWVLKHQLNTIASWKSMAFSAKKEQKRRKQKFLIALCLSGSPRNVKS